MLTSSGDTTTAQVRVVRIVNGSQRGESTLPDSLAAGGLGCVSSTTCFVVAPSLPPQPEMLYALSDGFPAARQAFAGVSGPPAMACTASQGCVAVGTEGSSSVITISATGVVRPAVPLSNPNLQVETLSCPSLSDCWVIGATDSAGDVNEVVQLDPQTGAVSSPEKAGRMQTLRSISCWAATSCAIGGAESSRNGPDGPPAVLLARNGSLDAPERLGPTRGPYSDGGLVNGLDCASASTCTAVGSLYRGGYGASFTASN